MSDIYKMRMEFLVQFGDYIIKNIGECAFLLWRSVLENNHPNHYNESLLHWTAIDERAWSDAAAAFANLTEDIRKVSLG